MDIDPSAGHPAAEEREMPTDNPTVYVSNINEKIKGDKLKRGLRIVFAPFGKIHKISVRKGLSMRGQAFIIYHTPEAALKAVRKAQNFNFYGKPLRVTISHTFSDYTSKKRGLPVESRPAHPKKGFVSVKKEGVKSAPKPITSTPASGAGAAAASYPHAGGHVQGTSNGGMQAAPALPHSILFAQGLPDDATMEMLSALFQQYPGFKEVRLIPSKKGIAFVEFLSVETAAGALQGLNDFKLTPEHSLKLTYANR